MSKTTLGDYMRGSRGHTAMNIFWELIGLTESRGRAIKAGGGISSHELKLIAEHLEKTPEQLAERVIMPGVDTHPGISRLEVAQKALAEGKTVAEAANIAGYQSEKRLRDVLERRRALFAPKPKPKPKPEPKPATETTTTRALHPAYLGKTVVYLVRDWGVDLIPLPEDHTITRDELLELADLMKRPREAATSTGLKNPNTYTIPQN